MGEEKGDPRELQNSPYKEKAEKIAREWYRGLDIKLGGKINLLEILEYWITYRLISIYEHKDIIPRGLDASHMIEGEPDVRE
jgi:hypothetical protein